MYMNIFVKRNLSLFNLHGSSESITTFPGGTGAAPDIPTEFECILVLNVCKLPF